jgi:NAD(P)-dependent dehydrogenase (short-subunit alcohol dehydrogenase family)
VKASRSGAAGFTTLPSSLPPAFARGHVAVVTGAASGIGLAACRRLADLGMKVVLADLDGPMLHGAAEQVASISGGSQNVLAWPTDVRIPGDLVRLREATLERFGVASVSQSAIAAA